MVRCAWLACLVLAVSAAAFAESEGPDPAGADTLGDELPYGGPRLRLSWPLKPQQSSFSPGQSIPGADGVLQPYRLEALWLDAGPLELKSFQRVEPSIELDCRLLCQPLLEPSIGVEARLRLGSPGRVAAESHAFVGGASVLSALRGSGQRLTLGLGGLLDL